MAIQCAGGWLSDYWVPQTHFPSAFYNVRKLSDKRQRHTRPCFVQKTHWFREEEVTVIPTFHI